MTVPESVLRPWQPVHFPQRSQAQVRAGNRILQCVNRLPVSLAGRPWLLTLSSAEDMPLHVPAEALQPSVWRLDLRWGDAPFQVYLPSAAAQVWLADGFPQWDLPVLPDPFVAALLETAARAILPALSPLGRGELRVLRIERAGPATYGQEATWRLQLKSESSASNLTIEGWLVTTRKGMLHLASCLENSSAAPGPLASSQLPLPLRAEVGFTWMTPQDWAGLRPGDAILVERPLLAPDGEFSLSCGPWGLRAVPEAGQLRITASWQQEGAAVTPFDDDDFYAGPQGHLRQVPLRVAFDVGELRLTVGEVEALQVGQTLDLGRPLSEAVQVRIHGMRVGLGELVDIDGRLGVVLRSLGNQSLADLPWEPSVSTPDASSSTLPAPHPGLDDDLVDEIDGLPVLPDLPDLPPPEV